MSMIITKQERQLVRQLTEKFLSGIDEKIRMERIKLWTDTNSLRFTRPPIYVRTFAWDTMLEARVECRHPVAIELEGYFRRQIFHQTLGDDYIFQPWYQSNPVYKSTTWGIESRRFYAGETDTLEAFKEEYCIKDYSELDKLIQPQHCLDEVKTLEKLDCLNDLIGDLMTVNMYRGSWAWGAIGDISTVVGHLRGIENIMLDVYENPKNLNRLLKFLSDGILNMHLQAEAAKDLSLLCHYNQAMPYASDLPAPQVNSYGVALKDLWCFMASQEFTMIGPEHHEEFLMKYQMPIMAKYGLVSYGCCEDLTNKIGILRKIPNLRRIAVSPFANVKKSAAAINGDYVISYRPNPSRLLSGYDMHDVEKLTMEEFDYLKGSTFDITLKDIETVEGDPERIRKWVTAMRRIIEKKY